MRLKPKVCTDPKHLAWVSWTFLANNSVNKTTYLVFCVADLLIILFYSFNLVQRVHFSNFDYSAIQDQIDNVDQTNEKLFELTRGAYENSTAYNGGGIQLTFLRSLDYELNNMIRQNGQYLLFMTVAILCFCLFIALVIFILGSTIQNHSNLEKSNFFKKCFTFILVALLSFLHMPLFDIIIRTVMATYQDPEASFAISIVRYGVCAATIVVFSGIMLFLVRIFNVCVPTELIPWCSPISKIVFMNLLIKAAMVICNAFDIQGTYALVEIVIFFLLQGFQACYRVLFAPNYVKEVDLFVKTKDFGICLVFFIGIICKVLQDQSNYDGVYFLIFIPVVTVGWILFEQYRMQIILLKVKTKSLKLEIENEYALYVMMTLVRDCMEDTVSSQKVFGQLMDLMFSHIEECDDQLCICDEMENFYELLRLKQLHNQEVFPLLRKERKKYKKIIDDQGLIGTVSNLTDITLKTNSTESTISRGNNDNDRLDRNFDQEERYLNQKTIKEDEEKNDQKLTVEQQVAKKKRNSTVYKINIDETKHRFLSELLYLFYFEMIQKFPFSFKIQLLSNYFALLYKRKEMLCVFQMRSFNKLRLTKLDQCCHIINEQYLLWEIAKIHKVNMHASLNQQEGNFNGDYFIKMNQLYKEFNLNIEALSQSVVNFWKIFERPQIDVDATHVCGISISKNILGVFKTFNELDTLKIFKDYQMYFQFAIVQLHILNDPVAYELYIGKMKSILEINKVYQKNFSQSGSMNTDQANFIIVDANGTKFGQIIQVNNSLRQLLGWTEDQVKRNTIENFMPSLIRDKHPEFMVRYNKTGQSYIINNKVTMFIKKANGYVIPVELYIKFHYSIDYQYTFLAIMKPFYEMSPFSNGVKYNINQLLFLVVDDDIDGRITEYSESCSKLLSQYGFTNQLEQNGITKNIQDVMPEFDFFNFKKQRATRYQSNEIYENFHKIDLNKFSDSNQMQYEKTKKAASLLQQYLMSNGGIASVKTRVFEERYSGGVLDLNIFCFAFVNDTDGGGSIFSAGIYSIGSGDKSASMHQTKVVDSHVRNGGELDSIEEEKLNSNDESQSATFSSSSMRDSTSSMAEFRNFHSFTEQATPKTLTLIIKMIVALYLIMLTIASVNLGINITRQMQSESDVHTVRQAFDRMNWVSMNQLLVRVLLNVANGYEPDNSILVQDRFSEYLRLQDTRVTQLKNTQSMLQQSNFITSEEFERFQTGKNVPLYYLSESNEQYIKYESLNVAFNLYIAKLTEMNSFNKSAMKGGLQIQTLNFNTSKSYRPSYQEQSLFFIVQNGNKELRQFSIESSYFYARESETHAEQNITQTKVTAIISIIIIVIIGLIIAPILTTAEIRKYKALLYFLKIPRDKLPDLIKNCEYCLNMNDEKRYEQIMKDYEDFLGIKLQNQQVDQLRQARDEKNNLQNQLSRENMSSSGGNSVPGKTSDYFSSYNAGEGSIADSRKLGVNKADMQELYDIADQASLVSSIASGESRRVRRRRGDNHGSAIGSSIETFDVSSPSKRREQDDEHMMDHNNERDQDDNMDLKEEEINNNKFNLANLNLKQNRNKDKKQKTQEDHEEEDQSAKSVQDQSQAEIQIENQEEYEFQQKKRMINARAYKRRSVMIFSSLTIILILSTYFIIAYFLAMKTFETAAKVIESLEIIFYKGSCFDSAMNFLRESQIRNESMYIKGTLNSNIDDKNLDDMFVATDYYIDFCYKKEVAYNQMRINLPTYFKKAENFILEMESANMCEHVYTGEFGYLREICKQSLNGILNKGLTNAFYYMFTQILKANLNFISLGDSGQRNATILRQMILDTSIVQIIDMKAQILDPALNQLKQICMDSVIEYIQKLLDDFVTAFIVFSTLLTVALLALIFIGFRILRKSMWDTNMILKVIPFEMLPKQDRIDIKDFFNS